MGDEDINKKLNLEKVIQNREDASIEGFAT